jgi:predicted transcriptional regulator of viral defense system
VGHLADRHQAARRYVLTDGEVAALGLTPSARRGALARLVASGRLVKLGHRRGIWIIVPAEYATMGAPPVSWVLDDIMGALDASYYVTLLSAAYMYGATHYALQVLQVASSRELSPLRLGRERVRFVLRRDIARVPTRQIVSGGPVALRVSTPEATALDLVRFREQAGGLSNVAGALRQMRDHFTPDGWRVAFDAMDDRPSTQRLGYLLTHVGDRRGAAACRAWLADRPHRLVVLEPADPTADDTPIDPAWKLVLNATPDVSL